MFLLKKLFQFREKAHPGHEKSFLAHLEDLRRLVTRMVVTLVLAMIVCFTFQSKLMEVLRRPVDGIWAMQQEKRLPQEGKGLRPLGVEQWDRAKEVEHALTGLRGNEREVFLEALAEPETAFHARAVALLKAARAVPEAGREEFLAAIEDEDLRRQVGELLRLGPDTEINPRGDLRLMSALRPTETFVLSMKLAFFAGIIVSFPFLLAYLLQFILPNLDRKQIRALWPAIAVGFGLFLTGICFAYYIVLPHGLLFFHEWSQKLDVSNDWRIGEYITFATTFTLLFGLAFELPVVVMALVKMGVLTYESMSRTRTYAVLAITVLAAVMTPPDPFTLIVLAVPMCLLYEICIWLAWLGARRERKREREESERRGLRLRQPVGAVARDEGADENPEEKPDENADESPR